MLSNKFKLKSKVWVYPGMAAWRFLTVPKKTSSHITRLFGGIKRGWGSLPVKVILGKSSWNTSIFPDKKTQSFLLPLKAEIRKKEKISDTATVSFLIEIR